MRISESCEPIVWDVLLMRSQVEINAFLSENENQRGLEAVKQNYKSKEGHSRKIQLHHDIPLSMS